MMKKLVVLFIAVAALFAFSACEPYAVTLDEPGKVEVNDVGIQNYNLSGKTLVRETYGYIKKTVTTIMSVTTNGTTTTTTSREIGKIPCSVMTVTKIFAADGTYTSTSAETYLAGADGDYRATTVSATPSPGTIVTTTTSYREYDYNDDFNASWDGTALDELVTGRTGKTIYTYSYAGTWERIRRQTSYNDSITWEYYATDTSSSSSSTPLISTYSNDAAVIEGTSNTHKYAYRTGNTTNTENAISDEPYSLGDVYWVRDDADGNDVVSIGGNNYTVQPQQ